MIESVFRDYLLSSAPLVGLVGARVYQNREPSNGPTYPLVVIRKAATDPTHAVNDNYQPGHSETRYMVLAMSKTFAELMALRSALRGLDGYSKGAAVRQGLNTDFNEPGTEIQAVMLVSDRDTFEGNEVQLFKLSQDFEIQHTESFTQGITA